MLTYYTVIGKNLDLIKSHLDNVYNYAGFWKVKEKEVLVVQYHNESTSSVEDRITTYLENNVDRVVHQVENKGSFIENLYDSWNLGYEHSKDGLVFRGGSDQVFSRDSFLHLHDLSQSVPNDVVLQANTIENVEALDKIGCSSRHLIARLGNNFKDFDYRGFEDACDYLKQRPQLFTWQQSFEKFGKPLAFQSSFGIINREDGCSWLMKRSDWVKYGPLVPIKDGITGDVLIHDLMQRDGYKQLIMRDVITYHFVRGESFDKY